MSGVVPRRSGRPDAMERRWAVDIGDHVSAAGCSHDGRLVCAASISGPVFLLDAADGATVIEYRGHTLGTTVAAWRPGHALLATGGQDGKVRLWSVGAVEPQAVCDAGAAWVENLAWSADGAYLASSAGKILRLWSPDGTLIREYPAQDSTIASIAWHPLREELAAASYGGVVFFSAGSGDQVRKLDWKGSILALAWSPDGEMIATGNQDSSVHFWFMSSREDLHMAGYPLKVKSLSWSADSRYLATSGSIYVVVWDCSGAGPGDTTPDELEFHEAAISQLAFRREGRLLASGGADGAVAVWRPGRQPHPMGVGRVRGEVSQLVWSMDERRLVAGSGEGMVAMFTAPR